MTSAVTSRTTATVLAILTSLLLLAALASPALAAHNGNNRADLEGDATGRAVVNYSEGQGSFNGTVTVKGLEEGKLYTFQVTLNGGNARTVCTLVAGANGAAGCSAQDLDLPGFNTAEIVDADGIVADGKFDRAGNCRDPQQGGSLCESPALNPQP